MNAYEKLTSEACEDGIEIIEKEFNSDRIKGLYCDRTIAINKNIKTAAEKADVLAEELGHYHTTVGDIIDMSDTRNRKQERQARLWSYNKRIGLSGIISAFEHGCLNRYEMADYLNVSEKYLQDAIDCYRDKYGIGTMADGYYIMFIPWLMVGKLK